MNAIARSTLRSSSKIMLLGLVFGIAYTQSPLYTSNQNTYFLHGLAQAGFGLLSEDWTAGTSDPFPLFSLLVRLTYANASEYLFYLYGLILLGAYVYAVFGIASKACGIMGRTRLLACFTALVIAHSAVWGLVASRVLGFDPRTYFFDGLAGQYLLGDVLQPSVFGVFLLVSIHSFLQARPMRAVVYAVVATAFHPTYVLGAASLVLSYVVAMSLARSRRRDVLFAGGVGLVLLALNVGVVYLSFGATSAESMRNAQSILVDHRIPHHAVVGQWFGKDDVFRLLIVAVVLFLVRKRRQMFVVLLVPFLVGGVLTIAQVVTGNKALALLFPWRVSVFLVPLSSGILIASGVAWAASRRSVVLSRSLQRVLQGLLGGALILSVGSGAILTSKAFQKQGKRSTDRMMDFVAGMHDGALEVLIPLDLETFRLRTRVPTFVDFKTHPYRDDEVVEWHERYRAATAFYAADGVHACRILRKIRESYGVTHVVLRNDDSALHCGFARRLYRDDHFEVYGLAGQPVDRSR